MAVSISNAFVQLFDAEVHQAMQGASVLDGTVRMRTGVEGSTYKFPKIGKGVASIRVPQSDVVPLNVTYSQVTATLSDYAASEYTDVFHQAKVNFNERNELAQVVGQAMARRQDQVILDALGAASSPETVANTIVTSGSATASNLNVGKIRETKKLFDKNNVPQSDRYMAIHADSLASLLTDSTATSIDFNQVKPLVDGQVNQFLGFNIVVMGDRDEGGLPSDGTDRTIYAWHKNSIGCAVGLGPKIEINYVAEKTSFLVTSMFSAGAVAVDDEAIATITCRL